MNNPEINQEELEKVFSMAWRVLYENNKNRTIQEYQDDYKGLQVLIMNIKVKNSKESIQNQIALLKVVDKVYKEIIDNNFRETIEEKGLSDKEAKALLYNKIFGEKQQENEERGEEQQKPEIKVKQPEQLSRQQNQYQQNVKAAKYINKNSQEIDFNAMYDPTVIATQRNGEKAVSFSDFQHLTKEQLERIPEEERPEIREYKMGNINLSIMPIGRLNYCNAFGTKTYMTKYSILVNKKENKKQDYVMKYVYSNIDLKKMNTDAFYRQAVLERLMSIENIERKNNEDYIGGISPIDGKKDQYKLYYSREEFSAVKDYNEQQKKLKERKGETR